MRPARRWQRGSRGDCTPSPMTDPNFDRLTPRQRDCLRGLAALKSAKRIGNDLGISESTVYGHLDSATKVLGAPDRATAALWFQAHERLADPQNPPGQPSRVVPTAPAAAGKQASAASGSLRLPFRAKGSAHNDLSPLQRLAWIPLLALAFAVGFGMLAAGLRFVTDFIVAVLHQA